MTYTSREVCQNFDLCLSFCFMSKNGELYIQLFFAYFFQNFIKKNNRTINFRDNLRHIRDNLRNIYFQKIKVKKIIFRYFPCSLKEITMHLYNLNIIRKASYSG